MDFLTRKPKKTRKVRHTRKANKSSKVIDVRSDGAVKLLEKAIVKGPLTLVYVNAKWCGACHKFNDEVWSHLTKLKNKSVNLASVDSEMFNKTSLAGTPPKFYPTLMLVGKDKKPATFKDEEGNTTNSMPRNPTLAEDKATLSNLIQNPTVKSEFKGTRQRENISTRQLSKSPFEANSFAMNNAASASNSNIIPKNKQMGNTSTTDNNSTTGNTRMAGNTSTRSREVLSSNPPDIGADLVSSQSRKPANEGKQSGGMLEAIRREAASLKSMLNMRGVSTRKNRK
jgi:thiol-disulfide isomerase/thioredoxin